MTARNPNNIRIDGPSPEGKMVENRRNPGRKGQVSSCSQWPYGSVIIKDQGVIIAAVDSYTFCREWRKV